MGIQYETKKLAAVSPIPGLVTPVGLCNTVKDDKGSVLTGL